jgi:hypothetical protein
MQALGSARLLSFKYSIRKEGFLHRIKTASMIGFLVPVPPFNIRNTAVVQLMEAHVSGYKNTVSTP